MAEAKSRREQNVTRPRVRPRPERPAEEDNGSGPEEGGARTTRFRTVAPQWRLRPTAAEHP